MPRRPRLTAAVRRQVTAREGYRCAYCRSPQRVGIPMVVDHILPLVAGGSSRLENLCLACYRCNEFKGRRTEGPDPGEWSRLERTRERGNRTLILHKHP
jgi:5-methylcytosine-specific restriction endonuclease McrA